MSFLNSFTENVHKYPNKTALEFIDPPLQRVTKSIEFILLHMATVRLGAITLPLNLAYPPDELKYFLEDSGAKLFFALQSSKEKIESILSELPDLQKCIFLDPSEPNQFQLPITNYQLQI